jgi:diguanylate cyclase (GGDEF)-like protein
LKAFAESLQRAIRGSDLAVRMGGDEFMVMLPECRAEEVHHVLLRLEGASINYEGLHVPCRFSRGWVDYRPGETAQEFTKRADDALYANKRSGKLKAQNLPMGVASQPAV